MKPNLDISSGSTTIPGYLYSPSSGAAPMDACDLSKTRTMVFFAANL